jgi:hypothetical protein
MVCFAMDCDGSCLLQFSLLTIAGSGALDRFSIPSVEIAEALDFGGFDLIMSLYIEASAQY